MITTIVSTLTSSFLLDLVAQYPFLENRVPYFSNESQLAAFRLHGFILLYSPDDIGKAPTLILARTFLFR